VVRAVVLFLPTGATQQHQVVLHHHCKNTSAFVAAVTPQGKKEGSNGHPKLKGQHC
jgi:hypothetical protein